MIREKLVSIIIPVYNAADFVEKCVRSVTAQTYRNIEIILVNDGSKDSSYDVCKKLSEEDKRIVLVNQDNQGVVSARNNGFEMSKGEFILFVDSDDWIECDMVETLVSEIGDADIVSSAVLWEKSPGKESIVCDDFEDRLYNKDEDFDGFFSKMIFDISNHKLHPLTPWMWNKMYKRELVESVYSQMDSSMTFAEDTTFIYKCFFAAKSFVITHKAFYHYVYNENSVCHREQRNILADINKVYISLYEDCKVRDGETNLMEQLQTWIVLLSRIAVNDRMKFNIDVNVPEFLLDTRGLEDYTKIIIYGAGQAGKDYRHQLLRLGYVIPLWVDSNYEYWKRKGFEVDSPEKIQNVEYDVILIAVSDENTMCVIKRYLIEQGIDETKIVWKNPIWF